MNKLTTQLTLIAVGLVVLVAIGFAVIKDTKPEYTKTEELAYDSVVTMYLGSDLNKVRTYDKAEVIKDIHEFCDNLTKHEYRSHASTATNLVAEDDLSYELALTNGVELVCPDAWNKAKKMN